MFNKDAEWAHDFAPKQPAPLCEYANECLHGLNQSQDKPVNFLGLEFKNPVGLAAGLR